MALDRIDIFRLLDTENAVVLFASQSDTADDVNFFLRAKHLQRVHSHERCRTVPEEGRAT